MITVEEFVKDPHYEWGLVHKSLPIHIWEDFKNLSNGRQVRSGFWYASIDGHRLPNRPHGTTDSGYCYGFSVEFWIARINEHLQTEN